jgi:hypothetical protein
MLSAIVRSLLLVAFLATSATSLSSPISTMSFYELSGTCSDGSPLPIEDYKGKVVYATNVASK